MKIYNHKGFTLVELMIALLIGTIVLAGIATFFRSQQRTYIAQEEVAEVQQELRSAMEIMTREIRNAGHDMTNDKRANAGFLAAGPFQVQFTMDLTDDAGTGPPDDNLCVGGGNPPCAAGAWDPNENIAFGFLAADDADSNGIADAGAADLGRGTGGGALQALSSNIQAVGFAYAFDGPDADSLLDRNAAGEVIWTVPNAAGTAWLPQGLDTHNAAAAAVPDGIIDVNDPIPAYGLVAGGPLLDQVRGVQIWILARASRPDPDYVNNLTYKVGANIVGPANDNFRRRLLSVSVRCRNMGLPELP